MLRRAWLAVPLVVSLLVFVPAAQAAPPQPSFTTSPSPQAGQPVTFFANDTGAVTEYLWNFGDGSQTLPSSPPPSSPPSHTYSHGGSYTVTLTAVDTSGTTSQTSQQVDVIAPPTAAFNPTEASVLAGAKVAFDGTQSSDPDGSITGYSWNFGDGTSSSASQPTHSFTMPGTYDVKLTVTDNHNESSAVTHQISVIAPPPIQTLVESIIPAPILVKFGSPSVVSRALVDLKQRLFCPGAGPVCRTTITETRTGMARDRRAAHAAASSVLTTRANGNAELALHLTRGQWKTLLQKRHLAIALKLVAARGAESVTSTLRFKLIRKR